MDLQSALVCVLVFVVSGTILFLISMFGMREKSYEEALAEQRQLTGGLLGAGKLKTKDKKQKKAGKKVKEKPTVTITNGQESGDDIDIVDAKEENLIGTAILTPVQQSHLAHGKLHVEFEEPAVVDFPVVKDKKRSKKMKPILLNKEKSPVADPNVSKNMPTNSFEKIHPKDEYEMLHVEIKEEIVVKQEKHEVEHKSSKPSKSKAVEKENTEEKKNGKGGHKEKKQKEHVQQGTPEAAPIPEEPLQEQVAVAKTAVVQQSQQQQQPQQQQQQQQQAQQHQPQQQSNSLANSAKDRKKKKSEFNTLQQMTAGDKGGVNVSLLVPLVRNADLSRSEIQILIDLLLNKQHDGPTIIDEWSEGRSDPVQKLKRQLAERERQLTEEQEALTSAQAKLREVRAELNSERSRFLQNNRNMEETLHAKHNELQQVAARLHTQNQKIQQMQAQINEEVMVSHKLRQELNQMQMQRQQMDMHLSQQKQELEGTFQTQLSQLRTELQEQQNVNAQLNMEMRNLREASHAEKELLTERVRQVEREAIQLKNELNQRELTCRQLEEYGKMLQSQVIKLEAAAKEAQTQSQAQLQAADSDRNKEIEILNLQNELASLRSRLQQRESQLTAELDQVKQTVHTTEEELKEQKQKNDIKLKKLVEEEQDKCRYLIERLFPDVSLVDNKNWMTEAEGAIQKYIKSLKKQSEINTKTNATNGLGTHSGVDVARLQAQVAQYRNIIEDTEGMLNKLQTHVEQEEINWRTEIQKKNAEIEILKEQNRVECLYTNKISDTASPNDEHGVKFAFNCIERSLPLITEQLKNRISELEESLSSEQITRHELQMECEALKERFSAYEKQLLENKVHLSAEWIQEVSRLKETNNSHPSKVVENHTNGTITAESSDLPNNSASSSSVSPTSTKPRNKKNKKKAQISN